MLINQPSMVVKCKQQNNIANRQEDLLKTSVLNTF